MAFMTHLVFDLNVFIHLGSHTNIMESSAAPFFDSRTALQLGNIKAKLHLAKRATLKHSCHSTISCPPSG